MLFYLNDERLKYELEKLSRLFLPFEKFAFVNEMPDSDESEFIKVDVSNGVLSAEIKADGKHEIRKKEYVDSNFEDTEREAALMLFDCFTKLTGYTAPWGILTGVRPAKLMGKLIGAYGEAEAVDYFKNVLCVSDKKTELCLRCRKSEETVINRSKRASFSLYISVPFCPSRCSYCSFVSHSVEQAKKLIPRYVELLCEELRMTGDIAKRLGLELQTVYIGGGTPTTLSAEQLTAVMQTVRESFDMSYLEEYTVEAGRPDTVTEEKLSAIKCGGATRISINPQTMNDDVLRKIGRRHTSRETVEAFRLARKCGFDNINTDLIAGLQGDTLESFKRTVDIITELDPENVTVHSLSMKRASNLTKSNTFFDSESGNEAAAMVEYANRKLCEVGIKPYYMYRQSKTVGNLENVGYSKDGFEGLYNVYIMDETHTILACGASAVTKLREPGGDHIERIFNYKYPYEYIERFDTLTERKKGIFEFYEKYSV